MIAAMMVGAFSTDFLAKRLGSKIVVTAGMLAIAIAFQQLNRWRVNCGATYSWGARAISDGLATFATCAGMIVLARDVVDGMADQRCLGLLDIGVRRNGYGRQVDSFEASLDVIGLGGKSFPGVFIRAPLVESTGAVEVIAEHDGHPVAVRQGRIVALCFHPELTGDLRLHREFVKLASS